MILADDVIIIQTESDAQKLLEQYECESIEKLADLLWFTYGVTLIDQLDSSEYTQVEAQNSPLFYQEAELIEDINQHQEELKSIYFT